MADAALSIKVGAEVSDAVNGFQQAAQAGENFSKRTTQSTQLARFAVIDFGHTLRDLPYALNNPALLTGPIDRVAQLFTEISQSGGGVKAALASIGQVLTGPGGILIGFELVTTAATLLFRALSDESDSGKEKLSDYQHAVEEVAKSTGDNAGRATTLVNAIQSGTLNTDQRKNAIKELQQINEQYFGSLRDEKGIVEGLTQAYDNYIKHLNQIGTAKAIESQLTNLFDKKLTLQLELDPKFNASIDPVTQQAIGRLKKQLEALGGPIDFKQQTNVNDILQNANLSKRIELQREINSLEQGNAFLKDKDYLAAQKQLEQINLQIDGLSKFQKDNGIFSIKGSDSTADLKSVVPILEEVKKIYEGLSNPTNEPLFKLRSAAEPDSVTVQILEAQIAETVKKAAEADSPQLQDAYNKLQTALNAKLQNTLNPDLHVHYAFERADIDDKDVKKFHDDSGKQLNDYMKKLPPLKSDIKVDPNLVFQSEAIAKLNQAIQKEINSLPAKSFEGIGEAIGSAIGKGTNPIQAAGHAIEAAIGDVLEQLGKALIEYGTVKTGLDAIFSGGIAIPGVAAIALGVGAEALGGLLKSAASSYHAFATGGIVTGPTLGLIGEAGPEVVFPLDRLNSFLRNNVGAGDREVKVTGVIRGRDLAIIQARDSKLQGMTS